MEIGLSESGDGVSSLSTVGFSKKFEPLGDGGFDWEICILESGRDAVDTGGEGIGGSGRDRVFGRGGNGLNLLGTCL